MTELTITDLYCGVGGSSTGAVMVPGVSLKMAANHWPLAIRVHSANHPFSEHDCADLSQVEPARYPRTNLLWISPECTNHSIAKGKKVYDPAAERSRATMWDVIRFAEFHLYDGIIVENVVDVVRWPLFPAWRQGIESLGYELTIVYLNSMFAWAGGRAAPQDRNRVYVLCTRKGARLPDVAKWLSPPAWCPSCSREVLAVQSWKRTDREPWGKYRAQYLYRCDVCMSQVEPMFLPAASIVDWSDPGQLIGERSRPLAWKTWARIAHGVIDHAGELLVPVEGRDGKRAFPAARPMRAQTTRNETGLLVPPSFMVELKGKPTKGKNRSIYEPLSTVAANGNHHMLVRQADELWSLHRRKSRALKHYIDQCSFRMLSPDEIRAAMALPEDYHLEGTKRERVKLLGNGVTPPAARDLVYAMREALTGRDDIAPDVWERRAAA